MEVTDLDHEPSGSPIDPVQVSMFNIAEAF
ncbi:hypothetical protein NC652_035455 [Populus alba x Populus x berolinensis]|nr:hypothetical protein NC652_035455 [Populus alba x Populus x berolinensis]